MQRYSTVQGFLTKVKNNAFSKIKYGDSVVDKSKFRPTLVNNGNGQRVVGVSRQGVYDFEDGKDTGLRYGVIRNLGADITEIDSVKQILEKTVDKSIKDSREKVQEVLLNVEKTSSTPTQNNSQNSES